MRRVASDSLRRGFFARKPFLGDAHEQIRIRRNACPHRALGSESDAGKIRAQIQQIQNDLKMKMRRPAAIFVGAADAREFLPPRDGLADFQLRESVSGEVAV